MKVKDLIAILQTKKQDAEVLIPAAIPLYRDNLTSDYDISTLDDGAVVLMLDYTKHKESE